MSQQRILVVDDDATNREVLQIWLAKANFDVILASNGEEAFRILSQTESLDLVLTDFMMPELNGIELIRRLKANDRLFDIPVVMSNNADPESRRRAIEMGASAYLLKTEGSRVLAEKVSNMMTSREPRISTGQKRTAPADQVQTQQRGLLALIRLAAQSDGLPMQAMHALNSAEKLAEDLFDGGSESKA
jgi:two-component system, chemotaxis family, chemotaxis protein CheY